MSFRGDEHQRYGHVPPVQYPVVGQGQEYQQQQQQQQQHHQQSGYQQPAYDLGRRDSFTGGDDGAYYQQPPSDHAPAFNAAAASGEDELFLGNTTAPLASAGRSSYASAGALSGYQHQFQDPSPPTPSHSYNPQSFAQPSSNFQRSQSTTTLPYHHQPPTRFASSASSYNASSQAAYTPQTYNPALYAGTAAIPQRHPTHAGYNSYGQSYNNTASAVSASQSPGAYGQPTNSTYSATYSQSSASPSPALSHGFEQPLHSPPLSSSHSQSQSMGYDQSYNQYSTTASNGAASSAPYPSEAQMPVGPYYASNDPYNRSSRSNSQTSPMTSPAPRTQGSPGLQRHPTNAPLPSRPAAEALQWNSTGRHVHNDYDDEHVTQESIMQDIEGQLGGSTQRYRQLPEPAHNGQYIDDDVQKLQRFDSGATTIADPVSRGTSGRTRVNYESDDDDDPEGTAGVLAMQQAELEDRRFSTQAFGYSDMPVVSNPLPPPPEEQAQSSESDGFGGMVDLGMLSGGYAGNLTYGGQVGSPPGSSGHETARPLPTPGYFNPTYQNTESVPAFQSAGMDYGGTGGLQAPNIHRQSFDDGDEGASLHSQPSGTESPSKDEYGDLFYHPGLSNRPLPALPPGPGSDSSSMLSVQANSRSGYHAHSRSVDSRLGQPDTPEAYNSSTAASTLQPERSISLSGHSHTPVVQAPTRSRTDAADERRRMGRQNQNVTANGPLADYDNSSNTSIAAFDGITLPSGRKKKFVPSKLNSADFRRCAEPWALSGLEAWIRDMGEGELDLKTKTIEEALINLFTGKIPMMNVADAEVLSNRVVSLMLEQGVLFPEEEWVKFGNGHISGVLWQLTGSGCYAPKLHDIEITGRCYSYHCTRTLKKVDLEDLMPQDTKPADEWHVFYKLKKEDWEAKPKKEVERQNILHEIVTGEENYIKQLDIFRRYYRDQLRVMQPPVLKPDKRDKFLEAVFGKLDTVQDINKDHLLAQLKYRQGEQGPWITGFSDVFREWIRKAKSIYIEYAAAYPRAVYMIRREAERNILFKRFLEDMQRHKVTSKQDWTHYLITPLQRLQRYILLLESVEHKMIGDSEEKFNLVKAIDEIKIVTHECDAKVAEMNKRVEMMDLNRMLVLRPGFHSVLNLDHLGRELIFQGELQRMGSKGVRWVDTHALLFDHYFILAKAVIPKDGKGEKKFDVSKEPIPMPLMFLESMNDEAIQKQKGITAPLGRAATATASGTQLNKVVSNNGRPGLEHVATSSSMSSSHLTPTSTNDAEGRILYPFKVKHLGHEVYTLYAPSARDRADWCSKIIETKTRHAKALFSQNAEPFRLRVLADASFHYDAASMYAKSAGVPVKGTPLDRAIQELESVLGPAQGVAPVCRAQVNCATGFTAFGKSVIAIGTDYGVYISDPSNPRGWQRTVQATRVTQIAVLEEFSVCLVIADKALVSYPLDVIAPVSEFAAPLNDNPRRAPQRLAKDVTYFATAKMKDRMLLFYKRKEGLHTSFKVLEPIFHKSTEKKSRLFGGRRPGGGNTETFRDFDEFFFPTECYSLSLFQTYIAVSTAKGIEMLTLDKKQPMSIPDLKAPAIANIASRIRDQRPLGMFRLNENEFILTYEDCAVYVDKHGDVSRTLIMEYTGKQKKARGATMYGQYLLLFNEDYVEVRNAENGRLRQIVAGRDVRVLDYGVRGPTGGSTLNPQQHSNGFIQSSSGSDGSKGTVKIAMCHPEIPGRQIILEMLLNDGHTEK
ncbi:CNH domain-containing protein [Dactylonectria estremocensis]|uniref:CNH domain-containing protein n=1 Tax=Dactylonectria estremocensis TaxID=1079267 RepID=A0A9P9FBE7_9HYPO|nr:CNH domain-containing protein [Dactylonectria estremocensis]